MDEGTELGSAEMGDEDRDNWNEAAEKKKEQITRCK